MKRDTMTWIEQAQCRHVSVSVFYAHHPEKPNRQAVDLCAACPVLSQCLNYALEQDDMEHGYIGGMTPRLRRREKRRRIETERRTRQQRAS